MIKATWEKHFVLFTDFLQIMRVFPTNFISAILRAKIYAKSCFHCCQKKNHEKFSIYYDKIQ